MAKIKYNPQIGDQYQNYKVISLPYHKNGERVVDCECICGSKRTVWVCQLKILSNCKICRGKKERKYDIGTKIGSLTVIDYFYCSIKQANLVKIQCDCGKIYQLHSYSLNRTRTCKECMYKISGPKHKSYKGLEFVSQTYFTIIKANAKRKKRKVQISLKYINNLLIQQNHKCILSNLPIKIGSVSEETTASLDRIDSNLDYIEGNVQWVHKDVNRMKQDFDEEYFIHMCSLVYTNRINND